MQGREGASPATYWRCETKMKKGRGLANFSGGDSVCHSLVESGQIAQITGDALELGANRLGLFFSLECLFDRFGHVSQVESINGRATRGKQKEAVAALEKAMIAEDGLLYQEPPDWYYPVRETLGNILLKAGRNAEAEKAFRDDLTMYPENGWSLGGLYRALKAQGKTKEAEAVRIRFEKAFAEADANLKTSGGLLALN